MFEVDVKNMTKGREEGEEKEEVDQLVFEVLIGIYKMRCSL